MARVGARGDKSAGAVLLENQHRAARELKNFHRQMRKIGPKGPVLPSQKKEALELFKKLDSYIGSTVHEKAKGICAGLNDPKNRDEVKKFGLVFYFEGYLKEAHRHALKADVSGDFALFLSTFEDVLRFLEKDYFSKPIEQIELEFIILRGSLDACAEACRIASLDFTPARAKYAEQTSEYLFAVKDEEKKSA